MDMRPGSAAPSPPAAGRSALGSPSTSSSSVNMRSSSKGSKIKQLLGDDVDEDALVQYHRTAKLRQMFGTSVSALTDQPPPLPPLPPGTQSSPPKLKPLPAMSLPLGDLNRISAVGGALDSARSSLNPTPRSARRSSSQVNLQLPPIDPNRLEKEVQSHHYYILISSYFIVMSLGAVVAASNGYAGVCENATILERVRRASACRHVAGTEWCYVVERSTRCCC